MSENNLTIIFYSANRISDFFMGNVTKQLKKAVGDTPIISVTHKPMDLGKNICVKMERSVYSIYKQILIGAKEAKTKYVATAEDDVLYPEEHFAYRPPEGYLAYDLNKWSILTWYKEAIYSKRENRRTMTSLIADRKALIATLEERYAKYPIKESVPERLIKEYWGEPGRFENHLGIKTVKNVKFECEIPSVVFSTPEALGFEVLGARKAHAPIRTSEIPYWGKAENVLKLYK